MTNLAGNSNDKSCYYINKHVQGVNFTFFFSKKSKNLFIFIENALQNSDGAATASRRRRGSVALRRRLAKCPLRGRDEAATVAACAERNRALCGCTCADAECGVRIRFRFLCGHNFVRLRRPLAAALCGRK
jgi:hypothetical protein